MRLLVVAHTLGITSSGKSTLELLNALSGHGVYIDVICSRSVELPKDCRLQIYEVDHFFKKPARLLKVLGNIIGRDLNYFFWRISLRKFVSKVLLNKDYDIVYGRGSPIGALLAALDISKQKKVPLTLHFADPIPATLEWQANGLERKKLINEVIPLLNAASLVSFVTEEMLNYQMKSIGKERSDNTFVLPNPIPTKISSNTNSRNPNKIIRLGFIGQLGKVRNPIPIFNAVSKLNECGYSIELCFVGTRKEDVTNFIGKHTPDFVKFIPYQSDITKALDFLDILIDIDSEASNQVFISNKLMEYIATDKPIISISSPDSPARKFTKDISDLFYRSDNNFDSIVSSIEFCIQDLKELKSVTDRELLRELYSSESLSMNLIERFKALLDE